MQSMCICNLKFFFLKWNLLFIALFVSVIFLTEIITS